MEPTTTTAAKATAGEQCFGNADDRNDIDAD
jgi:hypothetical protein